MSQKLKVIVGAPIAKIGKYAIATIGSLCHGGPYVIISFKGKRVGWVSFKTRKANAYRPKHDQYDDAKKLIDNWFKSNANYNLAAIAWNSMNIGLTVSLFRGRINKMKAPIGIISVKALDDFKLRIHFEGGVRIVDMKTFNLLGVGVFKKLIQDKAFFETVHLDKDHGVVTWEGGLMLENNDLYDHGVLEKNIEVATLKKY